MIPIAGTIRNAVKLSDLDSKWQQKKKASKKLANELDPEARQLAKYQEDIRSMQEGNQLSSLMTKLKSGADLSSEEIEYLKKNNPQLYKEYMDTQAEKKAYEKQLKNCKTKEDVGRLKLTKLSSFMSQCKAIKSNPNIPKGQKVGLLQKILWKTAAFQKVYLEFVKSVQYNALPTEAEEAEKAEEKADVSKENSSINSGELKENSIISESEAIDPDELEESNSERMEPDGKIVISQKSAQPKQSNTVQKPSSDHSIEIGENIDFETVKLALTDEIVTLRR